jgi:hypothetical protein
MEKVAVSKGILVGLGAGFFLSLLALGFFIGRESARKDTNPGPSSVGTVVAPSSAQSDIVQLPIAQSPESSIVKPSDSFSPQAMADSAQPPPSPPELGSSPSPVETPVEPLRAAVEAYFATIDQIQPGQMGSDAYDMANKIVAALARSDTSGLDGLIQQAESARKRLAALTPPPPCAAHHRESLACLDEGLKMLRSVKQGVTFSDTDGLSSLTTHANALLSCSDVLTREEKAIRQRFGLGH